MGNSFPPSKKKKKENEYEINIYVGISYVWISFSRCLYYNKG